MIPQTSKNSKPFLFQVEILIDESNNSKALMKLIESLSQGHYVDYRILSGIEFGQTIKQLQAQPIDRTSIPEKTIQTQMSKKTASSAAQLKSMGLDRIAAFKKNNTLIRLIVNKGSGVKLNIPCRILNLDESSNIITVYHVDEKQVYSFNLTEIEDIIE